MDGAVDTLPSIRLRQATSSTLQIADSDDEEGLEELAIEQETSYWTNVTADNELSSSPLPSPRNFGIKAKRDDVLLFDGSSPRPAEPEEPERLPPGESPDPMDMLENQDRLEEAPAMTENSQVIADSDEEMPSQELDSDLELLDEGVNNPDALDPDTRLSHQCEPSASPKLPPPLQLHNDSDSDEELPNLSQAFRPTEASKPNPPPRSPSPGREHSEGGIEPSAGGNGIKLVAIDSTPSSASSQEDSSSRREEADSALHSPPTPVQVDSEMANIPAEEPQEQGRALRKRTQAQLQPYTTDWMKFAKTAQRNQWGDLVTKESMYGAQHRPETAEEIAARLKKQKGQKVHTHGGWLEPDDGQRAMRPEDEARIERRLSRSPALSDDDDYELASPRTRPRSGSLNQKVARKKGRALSSGSEGNLPEVVIARSIRGELAQGGAKRPQPRRDDPRMDRQSRSPAVGNASASSSRITVEDQARQDRIRKHNKHKRRSSKTEASIKNLVNGRAESEPLSSPRRIEKETPQERALSSSPPRIPSAHRKKKRRLDTSDQNGDERTPSDAAFRRFAQQLSESEASDAEVESDQESSDNAERPTGDSPERPNLPAEDRFALKGKRKKAAQAMMPAIFFRKAEKDLALMREERKTGRIKHTLEREGSGDEDDSAEQRAQARVRINRGNANKPIRFVADESTSESDGASMRDAESEPEEAETQRALSTWTYMAQAKNRSKDDFAERTAGKGYWNKVIGNILVRDKLERQNGKQRVAVGRRRKKVQRSHSRAGGTSSRPHDTPSTQAKIVHRQRAIDQLYVAPTDLDDAESLFAAVPQGQLTRIQPVKARRPFRRTLSASDGSAGVVPAVRQPLAVLPKPAPQAQAQHANDLFAGDGAKFARFSFDFDIQPLKPGITFPPNSYIGKGYLHELVHFASDTNQHATQPAHRETAIPFGIQLDSDMEPEVFLGILPRLCDSIYQECTSDAPPASLLASSTGQALRFAIAYLYGRLRSDQLSSSKDRFYTEVEHLESRLDQWMATVSNTPSSAINLLVFKWYMLELAFRTYCQQAGDDAITFSAEEAAAQVLDRLGEITQALVSHGLRQPMKAVQKARDATDNDARCIDDLCCELWVCILHLVSREHEPAGDTILSQETFWSLIQCHLDQNAKEKEPHPILRGELDCYTAMSLACLSQFSVNGLATSQVRLQAYWPLFAAALDRIKPRDFGESYSTMSNTGRTRASRYIWTMYARCLSLSTRWTWQLLDQSRLLGKMFDILNARELQDMSIEGSSDYPIFLTDYAGAVGTTIERDDTVFRLLLRIIARMALEAEADGSRKAMDTLARLSMRVMPMRDKLQYPRKYSPGVVRKDRSILVNHYSLHVLLAAVDAKNASKRFVRFQAILDFENADTRARQDCLRAITYLGIVYKAKGLDISPIVKWLAKLAIFLRNQYTQLVRQRISLEGASHEKAAVPQNRWDAQKTNTSAVNASAAATKASLARIGQEMGETAIMMGVLLGAVQQLIKSETEAGRAEYPSLSLLNAAWLKDVLESSMARDPIVGSQVLSCINEFLECRQKALPIANNAHAARESQDEYGDFDFDYDDPALNAMLGVDGQTKKALADEEQDLLKAKDQEFSLLIKEHLSPAFYHLLSNLNVSSDGRGGSLPAIRDRQSYISDLVETWVGCASVLVRNNERDWSYYTGEFGKESWQRISDKTARYEIGLYFANDMLRHDETAYQAHRNQCIELLLRGLASPSVPQCLAAYQSRLLNLDSDLLFWRWLPYKQDAFTHIYEISEKRMMATRTQALREIFKNCKDILSRRFCRPPPIDLDVQNETAMLDVGSASDVVDIMRKQKVDAALVYKVLGSVCASMRDQLDALDAKKETFMQIQDYRVFCKETTTALIAELGPGLANDRSIPQLRLLAGVMSAVT